MDNLIIILFVIDALILLIASYYYFYFKKLKAKYTMAVLKKGILIALFVAVGLLSLMLFQLG